MKKTFLLLLVSCLLAACSSDDPEMELRGAPKEIKLSVNGWVDTQETEYEFEILEGNGDYIVSSETEAKATIIGNKVKVDLLSSSSSLTITDKRYQSASVTIFSTAESLVPHNYGIFMEVDSTYLMNEIKFGAGGYTVEKTKGNSAEVTVTDKGMVKVTGLKPGNSYYTVKDKRGTTAPLQVMVFSSYELTGDYLDITAVNDQIISIRIKYGEGWRVLNFSSPLFEKISIIEKGDINKKYDILQIDTSKENVKGSGLIELQDKNGNQTAVLVNIQ